MQGASRSGRMVHLMVQPCQVFQLRLEEVALSTDRHAVSAQLIEDGRSVRAVDRLPIRSRALRERLARKVRDDGQVFLAEYAQRMFARIRTAAAVAGRLNSRTFSRFHHGQGDVLFRHLFHQVADE